MTGLYLDAYSGMSGDMLLGAMLDLGAPLEAVVSELQALDLHGWELRREKTTRQGIAGTKATVVLDNTPQPARHLSDIEALLKAPGLNPQIASDALAAFTLLARAEAKVHGVGIEDVHFHEVGATDAIVDIVASCAALRLLGLTSFDCSPLPLGSGRVRTAHGLLPVPAPATLELLSECGASVRYGVGEGEMVTPTGAALVAHFGRFPQAPTYRPVRVGYGFGTREMPWPNALRAVLTGTEPDDGLDSDEVVVMECNIDDMNPELVPYVVERLLEQGALDAWSAQIAMKKGRTATLLSALVPAGREQELARTLLAETTTLGVRYTTWNRLKAGREIRPVPTPWGEVRVKLKLLDGRIAGVAPEFEDCARLAQVSGVPLRRVYDAAMDAARQLPSPDLLSGAHNS